jgi:hypothetical protein
MSHNTAESSNGIEQQWLERVREAQASYQQSFEHQQRTIEELNQALDEDVDASFALAQSGVAKLALDDLVKRQGELVNLVLRRNMSLLT